jgi:hypothetical protein
MVDRPASTSTLLTVASGQAFTTSLIPSAVGNVTRIFDVDSSLTDTSISGAYIDEIYLQYTKRPIEFIDAKAAVTGTYTVDGAGTGIEIDFGTGHNARVGQQVWADFTSWSAGSVPIDQALTITAITDQTITATIPSQTAGITGNVSVYLPIDIVFYAVNVGTITNVNQIFPLFVTSIEAVAANSYHSLTDANVLPYINHPVVQAGANFGSANSTTAPKMRGLMLKRGQALYAAASGATALTNGFYVNVQAGFY